MAEPLWSKYRCTNSYDDEVVRAASTAMKKATPGPWELWGDDDDMIGVVVAEMWPTKIKVARNNGIKPFANTPDVLDNAEFIVGSRSWVPRLCVMAKRLRDERDEAYTLIEKLRAREGTP